MQIEIETDGPQVGQLDQLKESEGLPRTVRNKGDEQAFFLLSLYTERVCLMLQRKHSAHFLLALLLPTRLLSQFNKPRINENKFMLIHQNIII